MLWNEVRFVARSFLLRSSLKSGWSSWLGRSECCWMMTIWASDRNEMRWGEVTNSLSNPLVKIDQRSVGWDEERRIGAPRGRWWIGRRRGKLNRKRGRLNRRRGKRSEEEGGRRRRKSSSLSLVKTKHSSADGNSPEAVYITQNTTSPTNHTAGLIIVLPT